MCALPAWFSHQMGKHFPAKADGMLLRARDGMKQAAAVRKQDREELAVSHHVPHAISAVLAHKASRDRFEGEAVLAGHALKSLQSPAG